MHHVLLGLFIEKCPWTILWASHAVLLCCLSCYYTAAGAPSLAAWYMLWRVPGTLSLARFDICFRLSRSGTEDAVTVWAWYFELVHDLMGLLTQLP